MDNLLFHFASIENQKLYALQPFNPFGPPNKALLFSSATLTANATNAIKREALKIADSLLTVPKSETSVWVPHTAALEKN
jgi:hypothetical protein